MPNEFIAVTHLLVDQLNPRLRNGVSDQPSAIRAVIQTSIPKFLDLAKSIAQFGLDPSNIPIVVAAEGRDGFFTVLEGNRRVTVLKCLQNSTLSVDSLSAAQQRALVAASTEYSARSLKKIECAVLTKAEARRWIELKHMGAEDGAALQPWGPREKRNFAARESGVVSSDMQVLDFVREHGGLTPAENDRIEKKFNITTLARILADTDAADLLGVEVEDGQVRLRYAPKSAARTFTRIIRDIATGALPVREVNKKPQIVAYVERVIAEEIPDARQGSTSSPLPGAVSVAGRKTKRSGHAGGKPAAESKALIPRNCHLHIDLQKVDMLYRNLQKANLEDLYSLAAVGFRVFFETSVDHLLISEGLKTDQQLQERDATLKAKVSWAHTHMASLGVLQRFDLQALKRCTDTRYYPEAITTMHAIVHSRHYMTSPSEVRSQFSSLRPFFEYVWRDKSSADRTGDARTTKKPASKTKRPRKSK